MMFENELNSVLDSFNLEVAEALSIKLHSEEAEGYEITDREDFLWKKLTDEIMQHWNN